MNSMIREYLETHKDEMYRDLEKFTAIPSVSSDKANVTKALHFILDLASEYGFDASSVLDDQVGVIEMGSGDETLGILAHVDVVPPGDPEDWETDPFEAVIKDGRMYARGTIDDKGMIIASLYAMMAVRELGLPLKKKVRLILGTQEEVKWTDMDAYVKEYELPDYGFTPDGEYPICNIEKGGLEICMDFDVSDDKEPDGAYLKGLDIGVAANVVPGKAKAYLSDGREITATGKAVHSCQPEKGTNAIFVLSDELEGMQLEESRLQRLLRSITEDMSDIFGEKLGIYSDTEYYQGEYVHRNAFSPTMLSAQDGHASLTVNVRYPYGQDSSEIIDAFAGWSKAHGGAVTDTGDLPAVFVSKERPFLKALAEAYDDISPFRNEFTLAYGGSYAKAMPNIVSWGPLFPGEEDTCHEPNEYIDLGSMLMSAEIFAESISKIALSEKSFR